MTDLVVGDDRRERDDGRLLERRMERERERERWCRGGDWGLPESRIEGGEAVRG